jgi:hypothetical protein
MPQRPPSSEEKIISVQLPISEKDLNLNISANSQLLTLRIRELSALKKQKQKEPEIIKNIALLSPDS